MVLDQGMLAWAIEARSPDPAVRIYAWDPPTLSVGAKIELPAGVADRCDSLGIAVVRRATGGGCVLHDGDLTYCVVAPDEGRSVLDAYAWVARCLIAGLAELGVPAAVAVHGETGRPLDCFQAATGADLCTGGRKICGSAQVRRRGWFLQHGSIPLDDRRSRVAYLLTGRSEGAPEAGRPEDDAQPDRSTWLHRVKPSATWEDLAAAMVAGFTTVWGTPPVRRPPRPQELSLGRRVQGNYLCAEVPAEGRGLPDSLGVV